MPSSNDGLPHGCVSNCNTVAQTVEEVQLLFGVTKYKGYVVFKKRCKKCAKMWGDY